MHKAALNSSRVATLCLTAKSVNSVFIEKSHGYILTSYIQG